MSKKNRDMSLPVSYIISALSCIAEGCIFAVPAFLFERRLITISIPCWIIAGVLSLMWKNVGANLLNNDELIYSNMWGKKRVLCFRDFVKLEENSNSVRYIFKNGEMSIVNDANVSDRLEQRLMNIRG